MFPTVDLGPLVLPTAGLVYLLGVWLALTAVERGADRLQMDKVTLYGLAVTMLAVGVVVARLWFVATHWAAYRENLLGIVWPLNTGYDLVAGLAGAIIAGVFSGRMRRLSLAATLDALAPGLIVLLLTANLADFLAGPGFGQETSVPWHVTLFGIDRHPVQLYVMAAGLLALVAWRWAANRPDRPPGQLFLLTTVVASAGLLVFDAYRANAWLTDGGYHVAQILSLIALVAGLFLLSRLAGRTDAGEPPGMS